MTAGGAGGDFVSYCFCCGRCVRAVTRAVREVIVQVTENIAGGEGQSAALRAPITNVIPGRLPWGRPARVCMVAEG